MTDELIGRRIGGYEIIDVLGRGGMATVYRAHQVAMNNRTVALKILPRQFLNDDTYLSRFERECQIVSELEHRSIVPVYEYGQFDGQPFIAMRYMSGGSVDDLIRRGPLDSDQIARILDQIAPALDYAHNKLVLHRDLKPSNVLLDDDGGAFLTDFGIARILGEGAGGTITTTGVVGTPSYMSPEQAQGKPLDGRSDIYALGVMLFEMATGRRPFEGETPYSIAVQQVTSTPPMPRTLNPYITPAVETVILTAMAKTPASRYGTAASLAEAVTRAYNPPAQALHDTQPGMPRPDYEATVPTTPPSPPVVEAVPSGGINGVVPAIPLPPAYLTPAPSPVAALSGAQPAVQGSSITGRPVVTRRRKRGPGWLVSAALGGGLGCGLLILIVGAIAVGVITLMDRDRRIATEALTQEALTAAALVTDETGGSRETDQPGLIPTLAIGVRPDSAETTAITPSPVAASFGLELHFFADRDDNFDLYRLTLASGLETRLTSNPAADVAPALAPDGDQIVFASDRDGDFDLYLIDRDGGDLRRLTDNDATDRAATWSPDGEWIAFSTETGAGAHALYRIRPDGSDLELLYDDGRRATDPAYTSDGRFLLFTYGLPTDPTTWEIARLDLITGSLVRLTTNAIRDWEPSFLPDGGIVYATDGVGYAAIARLSAAGDRGILYDGPGYDWAPHAAADGSAVFFTSDVSGRDEIYRIPLDEAGNVDGDPLPLTTLGGMGGR